MDRALDHELRRFLKNRREPTARVGHDALLVETLHDYGCLRDKLRATLLLRAVENDHQR